MRICLDTRYLSDKPTGIGRYSENLVAALARIDRENEYIVNVHETYQPTADLPGNFRYERYPWRGVSVGTLLHMARRIDAFECDVVHLDSPVMPLGLSTPMAVTFHDWQPFTVPDFSGHRPWPIRMAYNAFYGWHYPMVARKARRIVAISDAVRKWTEQYVPGSETKIDLVLSGMEPTFFEPVGKEEEAAILKQYPLPESYIFYAGSTRPNKHLPTLIRAFADLRKRESLGDLKLVLALVTDRFWEDCVRLIETEGLTDHVMIYERVSTRPLQVMYAHAQVVSLQTTDEGFGFPALEAQACGTPVVIADHGSLPEIAGPHVPRIAPKDANALANALAGIMEDEAGRAKLIETGRKHAKTFCWDKTAEQMLEVYRRTADEA